jgi:hypothetical protein
MRQVLTLLIVVFIGFSVLAEEKFYPATITFYDGGQFSGLAKFNRKQEVEFKISEEEEVEALDGYVIKRVIFHIEPYHVFEYVFYKNRYKLLQKIADGDLAVYAQFNEPINNQITLDEYERATLNRTEVRTISTNGNTVVTTNGTGFNHPFDKKVRFFIKNAGDNTVEDIKLNFRKEARKWFKDCPEIIEYTDRNEWKYEDLKQIVEFYNEFCGEE